MQVRKPIVIPLARASPATPPPLGRVPADHVEDFRPAATRYRRRLRWSVHCGALGAALVVIGLALPGHLMPWVTAAGACLASVALSVYLTLPALGCPACSKEADSGIDQFCPTCGSDQVKAHRMCGSWCNGCGRRFGAAHCRSYPIRYCSHCGVVLDEVGV